MTRIDQSSCLPGQCKQNRKQYQGAERKLLKNIPCLQRRTKFQIKFKSTKVKCKINNFSFSNRYQVILELQANHLLKIHQKCSITQIWSLITFLIKFLNLGIQKIVSFTQVQEPILRHSSNKLLRHKCNKIKFQFKFNIKPVKEISSLVNSTVANSTLRCNKCSN